MRTIYAFHNLQDIIWWKTKIFLIGPLKCQYCWWSMKQIRGKVIGNFMPSMSFWYFFQKVVCQAWKSDKQIDRQMDIVPPTKKNTLKVIVIVIWLSDSNIFIWQVTVHLVWFYFHYNIITLYQIYGLPPRARGCLCTFELQRIGFVDQ